MTLCHWLFKKPVLPGELDLTRIGLVLGYIGLMLLPFFRSLLIPSASRLMHYKSQARKDEAMIQELRTASLLERRRFQKYLSEELRIEEKHDKLWGFVLASIGSLLLAFAHGLGEPKIPYSWLLILVSVLAAAVQFSKWQVARKRRFEAYLETAEAEEAVSKAEEPVRLSPLGTITI